MSFATGRHSAAQDSTGSTRRARNGIKLSAAADRAEKRKRGEEKRREEKEAIGACRSAGRRAIRLHSTLIKVCATSYVSKSVKCRTERRRLLLHAHCKRTFSSPLLCEPHAESNTRHRIVSTKSPKDRAEVRNSEQSRAIGGRTEGTRRALVSTSTSFSTVQLQLHDYETEF